MATIYKEIWIEASPELVWDVVRDVGAVHKRFVPDYTAETHFDGVNRLIHFSNGNIVKELIVTRDDEQRRMAYAVVETKMPLQHHHASFQVFEDSGSRCRLVWITDFLPDQLAAEIQIRVDRGAEVMKRTIETEARNNA